MSYPRNQSRLVHETLFRHIKYHMGQLGWLSALTAPYGATALTIMSIMPPEFENVSKLEPGTAVVTIGQRLDSVEQEMGSTLVEAEIPFFFDVFMDKEATASAAADDVVDILKGRIAGTSRALKVYDFTATPPTAIPDWRMEVTDVEVDRSPTVRTWFMVRATAALSFPDTLTSTRTSAYPSASYFGVA